MRKHFEDFQKTSKVINEYLDLLIYSLCSRCAIDAGTPAYTSDLLWNVHHNGRINDLLFGVQHKDIPNFMDDIKHGMMHGLSTSIVSGVLLRNEFELMNKSLCNAKTPQYYSAKYGIDISFDKLNASCLLHDYLRTTGHLIKDHDKNLEKVFPNLMDEVYCHLKPKRYDHPFLISDVVELRRYDDYKKWYKADRIEGILSDEEELYFGYYYRNIRPSLEHCFIHRNETWLRHGAEVPQNMTSDTYPQSNYTPFAIEIDRLPFNYCFNHGVYPEQIGSWAMFRGILPFFEFKRKKCKVILDHPKKHDVIHAVFNTTFDDWVFVVDYKESDPRYQIEWVLDLTNELIARGHKVVQQETLNKFIQVANRVEDRMKFVSMA